MVDWWTEEDGKEYEARVEVMVEQANKFEVHGQTVKVGNRQPINEFPSTLKHLQTYSLFPHYLMTQGKLTSGENIADLGSSRFKVGALLLPLASSDLFVRGALIRRRFTPGSQVRYENRSTVPKRSCSYRKLNANRVLVFVSQWIDQHRKLQPRKFD